MRPISPPRQNVLPMLYNLSSPKYVAMIAMPTDTPQEPSKTAVDSFPVAEETVLRIVLPIIRDKGADYRKFRKVHARPAVPGEVVISVTDTGAETRNTASSGDMVVRNLTEAREEYIVKQATFSTLYNKVEPIDDSWELYDPIGKVRAIEISTDLRDLLRVGKEFLIMAPWGAEQVCREGDLFVAPLPNLEKVYRIARSEFDQTYRATA